MTLDEAIKHAEEVAEEKEAQAWEAQLQEEYEKIKSCRKCAEEHRQLAEWLKDYKQLKEQQSNEDCVSRQAVLAGINDWWGITGEPSICDYIRELPPVTPTTCIAKVIFSKDDLQELVDEKVEELAQHMESRWIPCSERLPQLKEQVLFCEKDKVFVGHMVFEYDGSSVFSTPYCNYYYVTAWMPLPKPYKAESEE